MDPENEFEDMLVVPAKPQAKEETCEKQKPLHQSNCSCNHERFRLVDFITDFLGAPFGIEVFLLALIALPVMALSLILFFTNH